MSPGTAVPQGPAPGASQVSSESVEGTLGPRTHGSHSAWSEVPAPRSEDNPWPQSGGNRAQGCPQTNPLSPGWDPLGHSSCPTTEWREPSLWLGTEAAQPAAEDRMVRRVSWSWHRAWCSLSAPGVSNYCRCRYEFIFSTVQWKNQRAAVCASEPHVVPGTRDKGRGASSSPGHHGLTQNRFLGERLLRGPSSRWPR